MKTLAAFATAIISAAVLFSAPASAEVTRAQVQAELAQARANGDLPNYGMDAGYSAAQAQKSSKTRAEVQAELKKAAKDGTLTAQRADNGNTPATARTVAKTAEATAE